MRDSNYGAQKPLYIEATLEQGTSRVAHMKLSQVVALLIERWDELGEIVKEEIAELLILPRSLYGSRPPLLNRVNRKTTLLDR